MHTHAAQVNTHVCVCGRKNSDGVRNHGGGDQPIFLMRQRLKSGVCDVLPNDGLHNSTKKTLETIYLAAALHTLMINDVSYFYSAS
jgi:hypothetical protein